METTNRIGVVMLLYRDVIVLGIIYLMMIMKRLLRVALLVILLAGVVYGVKNYHQIDQKDRILGEWLESPEELVNPVFEKANEGIEYFSGAGIKIPEAGSSGDNKEVIANDTKEKVNQLVEIIKELPEKQVIKIKEQIIQEIFPGCECTCSAIKND